MAVRQLGDWSPLDLAEDPIHADPELVEDARKRYQKIATTIGDAVAKLKKITETSSESLKGKYVEGLRDSANKVKENLEKAKVRYDDVAREIKIYQPELDRALDETKAALEDARNAKTAQNTAAAMPDGQAGPDGNVPPEEQEKDRAKRRATEDADNRLTAAKNRLRAAMDALDVAGKRFGDAVNCNNYDDGLTDKVSWTVTAVLKKIGEILSYCALVLGILAFFIPGVAMFVAGAIVAVAALAIDISLMVLGEGDVTALVMSAIGLAGVVVAGVGVFRELAKAAKAMKPGRIENYRLDFLDSSGRPTSLPGQQPTGAPGVVVTTQTTGATKVGLGGALRLDFQKIVEFWRLARDMPDQARRPWAKMIFGIDLAPKIADALHIPKAAGGIAVALGLFAGGAALAGVGYGIYDLSKDDD